MAPIGQTRQARADGCRKPPSVDFRSDSQTTPSAWRPAENGYFSAIHTATGDLAEGGPFLCKHIAHFSVIATDLRGFSREFDIALWHFEPAAEPIFDN